jgi:hypothetical protein
MDELSNRVRELAPDVDVATEDIQRARVALSEAISAEPARPGRTLRSRPPRRWHLPAGALAAAAAVVIVALVAAGVALSSQWFSQPARVAHDWAEVDLSRPLLEQLEPGQYLRVGITAESATRYEADGSSYSDDSYVIERTSSAQYLATDAPWVSVSGDPPPVIVDTVGPDGEAMAQQVGIDEPPYVYEADTPDAGWLEGLPGDAEGLFAAFAERHGSEPPASADDSEQMFWMMMLQDPAWYALTSEQRRAVVEAVGGESGPVRATGEGGVVELTLGDPAAESIVFDEQSMLAISGRTSHGAFGGDENLPDSTWTMKYSIVDEAPQVVIPDDPATSSCNGTPIPGSVFYYDDLDEMLDDDGRAAVQGAGVPALAADEWYVVSQAPEQVVLWSWVLHGEHLTDGPVPTGMSGVTHELMTIAKTEGSWRLADWETCVLKQELPDHEVASVELDPAFPLSAASTELHLLVSPVGCSAEPAEVVELQEFDEVVEVLVGIPRVDPEDGCADPVTQTLTVPLTSALGERGIRDLTYMESRMLRGEP